MVGVELQRTGGSGARHGQRGELGARNVYKDKGKRDGRILVRLTGMRGEGCAVRRSVVWIGRHGGGLLG